MSEDNHSLGQRVFHRIREDILSGKYKKNEELKEKTLGEELGAVSYTHLTLPTICSV